MMLKFYCLRCQREVNPIMGKIVHPHLGIIDARVCPMCLKPVTIKENWEKVPA